MTSSGQSVRATGAQEQHFRIDRPNSRARTTLLVGLDLAARDLAQVLAEERPMVRTVLALGSEKPDVSGDMTSWTSAVSADAAMTEALGRVNLVVVIASAGSDAGLVSVIGELCQARGLGMTVVLVNVAGRSEEELASSLGRLRPFAAMVVVTDEAYVAEMLWALRV